jgi:hypothetical protein
LAPDVACGGPFNPSRYGVTDERVAEICKTLANQSFGQLPTRSPDFGWRPSPPSLSRVSEAG